MLAVEQVAAGEEPILRIALAEVHFIESRDPRWSRSSCSRAAAPLRDPGRARRESYRVTEQASLVHGSTPDGKSAIVSAAGDMLRLTNW